eukprot:1879736-Pleurochrysis_carterae.AAC.2
MRTVSLGAHLARRAAHERSGLGKLASLRRRRAPVSSQACGRYGLTHRELIHRGHISRSFDNAKGTAFALPKPFTFSSNVERSSRQRVRTVYLGTCSNTRPGGPKRHAREAAPWADAKGREVLKSST